METKTLLIAALAAALPFTAAAAPAPQTGVTALLGALETRVAGLPEGAAVTTVADDADDEDMLLLPFDWSGDADDDAEDGDDDNDGDNDGDDGADD
jgi:hypothetical protein